MKVIAIHHSLLYEDTEELVGITLNMDIAKRYVEILK